jgi:hypothetical protein
MLDRKKKSITGFVSKPFYDSLIALKKEQNVKTHGKLLEFLIMQYRDAQAIVDGVINGELVAVNPRTFEDDAEDLVEVSKIGKQSFKKAMESFAKDNIEHLIQQDL